MKCKPGDLAIIVKSLAGNEGKIVRCIKYLGEAKDFSGVELSNQDYWQVDATLPTSTGTLCDCVSDAWMRPLRGDLLKDETTTSKELEAA